MTEQRENPLSSILSVQRNFPLPLRGEIPLDGKNASSLPIC